MNRLLGCVILSAATLVVSIRAEAASRGLIPLPVRSIYTQGVFSVTPNTLLVINENGSSKVLVEYLSGFLDAWFGTPLHKETAKVGRNIFRTNYIALAIDSTLRSPEMPSLRMLAEGYTLNITPRAVEITGVDYGGLFNGIQTLLQLMPSAIYERERHATNFDINCLEINDWPRFRYRGMMLDVARTFSSVERVKRFIDRLAYHKINRFHWHLTDDEGWRIEIKRYPDLAPRAGFRGTYLPVKPIYGTWDEPYGGFYTQDEIRDVVAYAALRNIEIIPEVELPGHSRAFARAYPEILCVGKPDTSAAGYDRRNVWCATREENYQMLRNIFAEICALFPSPYIHVGGDEVQKATWLGCPTCSKLANKGNIQPILDHFISQMTKILAEFGKRPAVWCEACESGKLDKNAHVYGWQHIKSNLEATAKGYNTVVVPGSYCYFDMKQSPWERGLTWAGVVDTWRTYSLNFKELGFSSEQLSHVVGVQGAFFSELLYSNDEKTFNYLDYQCYPRICAIAEVAWTPEAMRNSDEFHDRLYGKHADRLTAMNIRFRLPPPEALFENGAIIATTHQRHQGIDYVETGRKNGVQQEAYCCPIEADNIERYRFMSFLNNTSSPQVPVVIRHTNQVAPQATTTTEFPLPEKEGLWYLRVIASQPEATIKSIQIVAPDTTYYLIKNGQKVNPLHLIRFTATRNTRGGKMVIILKNENNLASRLSFLFERSPYIEPAVSITSSMGQNTSNPLSNASDYNFTSYGRTKRTCNKGDNITFTFAAPVECQSIDVQTGYFYIPRYHIPEGYVEVSRNGVDFVFAAQLKYGKVTVIPPFPVKVLRIISQADGNSDDSVAIQDLKITPFFK